MARPKQDEAESSKAATRASSRKRTHKQAEEDAEVEEAVEEVPSKKRRGRPPKNPVKDTIATNGAKRQPVPETIPEEDDDTAEPIQDAATPSRRKRKALGADKDDTSAEAVTNSKHTTPRHIRNTSNSTHTPTHTRRTLYGETPKGKRNDRSARKKSARALIERVVGGEGSEDDDEDITREIYESEEDNDDEEQDVEGDETAQDAEAATPSKKPRGRPKGSGIRQARKKSPTPPRDLPPHEMYFAQNRPGSSKTSNNNLSSLQLLTHEEYFSILHKYEEPHAEDVEFLQSWHAESFPQWAFELAEGFSICLHGYGSKRLLLHKFAKHMYNLSAGRREDGKVIIVNGYVRGTSIREILGTVGSAVDPAYKLPAGNPSAMLDSVKSVLSSHDTNITIILNSIDAVPLRKTGMQAILAQLASHPHVQLICSADTPDFPLLWDSGLRSAFNVVFHDCTTFAPFTAEVDVVDDVHELLGRKARRVGGKEGVTYVLRSLPENAKNLFRLLVGEVLVALEDEGLVGGENPGIEYRMLYGKAVEEFICSSEMAFRTLLKEFHDHQMITSRKDVLGTEILSVPFRKEELEAILEDLMS